MQSRLVRRVLWVAGLLCFTTAVGMVGFRLIEGETWFDGFYETITTISAVGDPQAQALSHAGKVFNAFLILFGVTAMFLALGAMTQTIIELELQDVYGKRRKRRMIHDLKEHYIVCGFGRVGRNASVEFQRVKAPFVVIDRDEQRAARATALGMLAIVADATQDASLQEAGIERAKGLIAALPSDAENLFVILSAKAMNAELTVVTRASEEEAGEKLRRAGADTVLTPYAMAGRQLADVMLRPQVFEFLDFARNNIDRKITLEQVRVANGGGGKRTVGQIFEERRTGAIVIAIRKRGGETIFNPAAETQVAEGDFLIVMGERGSLAELEKVLTGGA